MLKKLFLLFIALLITNNNVFALTETQHFLTLPERQHSLVPVAVAVAASTISTVSTTVSAVSTVGGMVKGADATEDGNIYRPNFSINNKIINGNTGKQFFIGAGLGYDFLYEDDYVYVGALQNVYGQSRIQNNSKAKKATTKVTAFDYQLYFDYSFGSKYLGYFGLAYDKSLNDKFATKSKASIENIFSYWPSKTRPYVDDPSYLYGYYVIPRLLGFTSYVSFSPAFGKHKSFFTPSKIDIEMDRYNYYIGTNNHYQYKKISKSKYSAVNGWSIGFNYEWNIKGFGWNDFLDSFKLYENTIIQQNSNQKEGLTIGLNTSYLISIHSLDKITGFTEFISSNNSGDAINTKNSFINLLDDDFTKFLSSIGGTKNKIMEKISIINSGVKVLYYYPGDILSKLNVFFDYKQSLIHTPRAYYAAFKDGAVLSGKNQSINARKTIDLSTEVVLSDSWLFTGALYLDNGSIEVLNKSNAVIAGVSADNVNYYSSRCSLEFGYYFNDIILEGDSSLLKVMYYYDRIKMNHLVGADHNLGIGISYSL